MEKRLEKNVAQWYWCKDWKNEWAKAYYVGPKVDWMTPMKQSAIDTKLKTYVDSLNEIPEMQDRYLWLMELGKRSSIMPERFKLKEFEVPGCQSQTWLVPHFSDDRIYFTADSAALISKGMVCLLADVFSGSTKKEIAAFDEDDLKDLELDTLLTPGRRNGVYSMLKVIQKYGDK
jgi:cysteine desulfuration protein SufE